MNERPRMWAWTRRVRPRAADMALAGFLTLLGLASVVLDVHERAAGSRLLLAAGIALLLAQTVPLVWRRDHPITVLAVISVAYPAKLALGLNPTPPGAFAAMIALYSVSVYSTGRWRSLAGVAAAALFVAAAGAILVGGESRSSGHWRRQPSC